MIRKRKFSKPFDLSHSILFNEFPNEYTSTIGVPGKFVEKCNRRVHLKDGTSGEMDSAFIADSDNRILFERVADVHQQPTEYHNLQICLTFSPQLE